MGELRVNRRRFLGAGAAGTLGVLLAPAAVLANEKNGEEVELLRWDLVQIVSGVVLPGGTDVAGDAGTGDKVSLTGSGQAEPKEGAAAGGGTFVHRRKDGSEVAHGVYFITGLGSFANGGGSLVGTGLTDGIGKLDGTTGGDLSLKVRLIPASGGSADGVLGVHCELPGSAPTKEGVTLSVGPFKFVQDSGGTLFHVLAD